ncbi:DoxX family membrane protein [Streptomyces sp. NPDC090036]|uniref:DoxX family membrane protein n=1 Tax=Streptomyces sp. NPDC090036 TaxID=3365926 RepID=UPI0038135BCA
MLSAPLVASGLRTLRRPEAAAEAAQPVIRAVGKRVPVLARDPLQLVRVAGAIQTTAGLLFATGRAPRLAALTLAATLVPTSLTTHAFWTVEDPEERARQRAHFLTDLSALGGLLIAAADTHGKPRSPTDPGTHSTTGIRSRPSGAPSKQPRPARHTRPRPSPPPSPPTPAERQEGARGLGQDRGAADPGPVSRPDQAVLRPMGFSGYGGYESDRGP